jgi:16S rRNA processing protein RimM
MEKSPPGAPDDLYLVGKILSAHGIRGEVNLEVWTDRADRFRVGKRLWSLSGEDKISLTVEKIREGPRGLIVQFEGIRNRSQAEQLSGSSLAISDTDRGDSEPGAYYVSDVIGCRVVTDDDHDLGRITDIAAMTHHDLYVVEGPYGEILVPAVREFILEIDTDQRRVVIRNLEAFWDGDLSG